jgi:uncharacterized protein YqcC (DUF446 family)
MRDPFAAPKDAIEDPKEHPSLPKDAKARNHHRTENTPLASQRLRMVNGQIAQPGSSNIQALLHNKLNSPQQRQVHSKGTFFMDTLPLGRKAIGYKWVLKPTRMDQPIALRHGWSRKVSANARGSTTIRRERVDYYKTFR